MRNYKYTLPYTVEEEGDFAPNPLSSDNSLALDVQICRVDRRRSAALADDLHSLHLKSLVDEYLQPSSACPSYNSPFFSHITSPFNHNLCYEDQKILIHELKATFQNVGECYGDLRNEIMRAIGKGDIHTHPNCGNADHPSYELPYVLVLEHLRKMGFNAGICKSQRDPQQKISQRCPNFPAEEYVYMDVILQAEKGTVQAHASERIIIDLRFRSQFEIARPSAAYMDLLKVVPMAYVGTPRILQKVLRSLSEAMKKSLESQGMPFPPWRRLSFLHFKWLSPLYSRSIFAPPLTNLNHIINKSSTKRENSLSSPLKSPSSHTHKSRECSHHIMDNNPTCGATKPSSLVDSKHKSTKRENSHSISNNAPSFAKSALLVDSKRILKSSNLSSHIPRNGSNKQLSIQSGGEPMKVAWQLPPLSNPPSSLKQSRRLVGALTIALCNAGDFSVIRGPSS